MSVTINGKVCTLANYLQLTEGYSPDIQDEVRSAILDDIPIGGYVEKCKGDSFKLNQIRLAIREYVPARYISHRLSASNLRLIRTAHREGISLNPLEKYISPRGILSISCDSLDLILSAYLDGADISQVDFTHVREDTVDLLCSGLRKGYPMWVVTTEDPSISRSKLSLLMKCMNLNLDIHPFLTRNWNLSCINLIAVNANKLEYTVLMKHVNERFSEEQLTEVISVATEWLDFLPLCLKDEQGTPLFNEYQMSVLGSIIKYNSRQENLGKTTVKIEDFLKPKMSDMKMLEMFDKKKAEISLEESKVLGGKLPKRGI